MFVLGLAVVVLGAALAPAGADAKPQRTTERILIRGAPAAGKVSIYKFLLTHVQGGKAPTLKLTGRKNSPKNLLAGGSVVATKTKGTFVAKIYLVNPGKALAARSAEGTSETVNVDGAGSFHIEDVQKVKDGLGKISDKLKQKICQGDKDVAKELKAALNIDPKNKHPKSVQKILRAIIRIFCGEPSAAQYQADLNLMLATGINVFVLQPSVTVIGDAWTHNTVKQLTNLCIYVHTTGGVSSVNGQFSGPGVVGPTSFNQSVDPDGNTVLIEQINRSGAYTTALSAFVGSVTGQPAATASHSTTVADPPTNGPAPAGKTACPMPS
jgi:hypothetical protein